MSGRSPSGNLFNVIYKAADRMVQDEERMRQLEQGINAARDRRMGQDTAPAPAPAPAPEPAHLQPAGCSFFITKELTPEGLIQELTDNFKSDMNALIIIDKKKKLDEIMDDIRCWIRDIFSQASGKQKHIELVYIKACAISDKCSEVELILTDKLTPQQPIIGDMIRKINILQGEIAVSGARLLTSLPNSSFNEGICDYLRTFRGIWEKGFKEIHSAKLYKEACAIVDEKLALLETGVAIAHP